MSAGRQGRANTESVDNYLKAILSLGGSGPEPRRVASTALADRLGVAPASVTNMLQKLALAAMPLVEYERHRGVLLSAAGKRRALEVLRHHRLIETFLYEVLDYPLEEVHEEAERLEHFISERFEQRIAAKLGHPTTDPHGHVIPTLDGQMTAQPSILLSEVEQDGTFVIESVSDRDATTLRLLEARGLTPGKRLTVRKAPSNDSYSVSLGRSSKAFEVPRELAEDVRIVAETANRR
jgi:DtxR family Mn-dependent transcriptional regulator